MKFRTGRKLTWLKDARHRRGFGIHSPWLFRLITEVIENKKRLQEYKIIDLQRIRLTELIKQREAELKLNPFFDHLLKSSGRRNLLKAIEVSSKYGKLIMRLVNDLKPGSVAIVGPSFGLNILYAALNELKITVNYYKPANYPDEICKETLIDAGVQNVKYLDIEYDVSNGEEFVFINSAFNPDMAEKLTGLIIESANVHTVLIISGIHESLQIEAVWNHFIKSAKVRISLDLFEIGIAIFSSRFQKEHFILRF
jgi:hypothetical protein